MLSVEEKVLLLDEVAQTARSSWQIHLVAHEIFSEWPVERDQHPAFLGYCNHRNLLSYSLMTACHSLIETSKKAYSLHHAMSDDSLKVSSEVRQNCEICFSHRKSISTYRNNVVAHVNARKTQSAWAAAAGIKNGDIDDFLQSARAAVEGLARDNLGAGFVPVITMPVRFHFQEFCRVIAAQIDHPRQR